MQDEEIVLLEEECKSGDVLYRRQFVMNGLDDPMSWPSTLTALNERSRAVALVKAPEEERRAAIRLGAVRGWWRSFGADGSYLGDTALALAERFGVSPQRADPGDAVASVGFSKREQAWYGWSHRAYASFRVGDVVEEGDVVAAGEAANGVPAGFKCRTLGDCERLARIYAHEVG